MVNLDFYNPNLVMNPNLFNVDLEMDIDFCNPNLVMNQDLFNVNLEINRDV